jgi:hypothetical protein
MGRRFNRQAGRLAFRREKPDSSRKTADRPSMQFSSVNDFLIRGPDTLAGGPVALVFAEDPVEVNSTLRHHFRIGFRNVVLFGDPDLNLSPDLADSLRLVPWRRGQPGGAVPDIVSRAIPALAGRWIHFGYNGEYLYFPFCESRTVGEFTAFVAEERRATVSGMVVDLYAPDLSQAQDGVSLADAHFDRAGYYATGRKAAGEYLERQVDLFGGLRWRYEEHVRNGRRRIDRVALFQAAKGLVLDDDLLFSDPEYNTYSCPWHNNPTAAILSFRAAKSLATNPGSSPLIDSFLWSQSERCAWQSGQLLELGMMEPGQWF